MNADRAPQKSSQPERILGLGNAEARRKTKERWDCRWAAGTSFHRADDRWYLHAALTEETENTEDGLGVALGGNVCIRVLPRQFAVGFSDHITSVTSRGMTVKGVLSK